MTALEIIEEIVRDSEKRLFTRRPAVDAVVGSVTFAKIARIQNYPEHHIAAGRLPFPTPAGMRWIRSEPAAFEGVLEFEPHRDDDV